MRMIGFVISPLEIIVMRLVPLIIGIKMCKSVETIISISCLGWFSFFYLGYLLGNGIIELRINTKTLGVLSRVY